MRIVETRPDDEGGGSRTFRWPVLEAGNESYPNGTYRVECEPLNPGQSFRLRHEFEGVPLLDQWESDGHLTFVCTVASRPTMYRRVHHADEPTQEIDWKRREVGEFPMFTPMVVARRAFGERCLNAAHHGVHPLWSDRSIEVPKGARLAVGRSFKFRSGVAELLDFQLEEGFDSGRFEVHDSAEEGFKFKVKMAANLHAYLQRRPLDDAGRNIVVHMVTAALALLQRKWTDGDADWNTLPNLRALADHLGAKDLKTWDEEDFCPEAVATELYPLTVVSRDP